MKLIEALEVFNRPAEKDASPHSYFLACGFEPLHLKTFLGAHLRCKLNQKVEIQTGVFGDLAGNLARARNAGVAGCAIAMEWPDLDSRLGQREAANWLPEKLPDILSTARAALLRLEAEINELAVVAPVAISLPALPLPHLAPSRAGSVSPFELSLRSLLSAFCERIGTSGRVLIADVDTAADSWDIRADLLNGFPYTALHADRIGAALARLLCPEPVRKGLITDLDDTFWKGIIGDAGADGVAWDLAGKARGHGIYQQFLHVLATRGVLLAVASKNDAALVRQAFERTDILMPASRFYPLAVHWRPKSESVTDILKVWNVGVDSVVFVDDNPMELAEVKAAHPAIETLQFPKDPGKLPEFLSTLADWFGKETVLAEDLLRAESIRSGEAWREAGTGSNAAFEDFLAQAQATVTIRLEPSRELGRPFELVNKTNQFNLNGRRYSEADWQSFLSQEDALLATVSYEDKFGPLGIISVALIRLDGELLEIPAWVLSCRAFARRIEHQFLTTLLKHFPDVSRVSLDYRQTDRNGPTRDFLQTLGEPAQPFTFTREAFFANAPALHHNVVLES